MEDTLKLISRPKPSFPGHEKLMKDLKGVRVKVEHNVKKFNNDPTYVNTKKELEELRMKTEAENSRLMKIKYEEKIADDEFKMKRKEVEKALEELTKKNREFLQQQAQIKKQLSEQEQKVVGTNDRKKANEEKNIKMLTEDIALLDRRIAEAQEELKKKKDEKHREHIKLHRLSVYETFLQKVMISSGDYEKEDKPSENIKKMIDRYRLLIAKQQGLKHDTILRDEEREKKISDKHRLERDLQNQILTKTSHMHAMQAEIDKLQGEYRELENDIQNKITQNQVIKIEYAKIIMAVNNLFNKSKYIKNPEKEDEDIKEVDQKQLLDNSASNIVIKLETISGEMQRLKFFSDKYQEANSTGAQKKGKK